MNMSMSTETKVPSVATAASSVDVVIEMLEQLTAHMSAAQLLAELQLAVERLAFSQLHVRKLEGDELLAELDILFVGELSEGILKFIRWLAEQGKINVLYGRPGVLFLDHCIKVYDQITEVHFVTAVELHASTMRSVTARLGMIYTEPHRVVYDVMPSLVAGFVIQDGSKVIDKSLRTMMAHKINQRVHGRRKAKVAHG